MLVDEREVNFTHSCWVGPPVTDCDSLQILYQRLFLVQYVVSNCRHVLTSVRLKQQIRRTISEYEGTNQNQKSKFVICALTSPVM